MRVLQSLLSSENAQLQDWTLIAVSVITANASPGAAIEMGAQIWERLWTIALRRIGSATQGRTAALLLRTCMRKDRIDQSRILQDLETLGRDLEINGPIWPSDTACDLLCDLLKIATTDLRIHRLNLPDKIYARMIQHWNFLPDSAGQGRTFGAKARSEFLCTIRLHFVLVAMIGLDSEGISMTAPISLPDCSIVAQRQKDVQLSEARNWYFRAQLATTHQQGHTGSNSKSRSKSLAGDAFITQMAARIVSYLRTTLTGALAEASAGGKIFWETIPVERARRLLDLSILAVRIDARLDAHQVVRAERNTETAGAIIGSILPRLSSNKWSISERAYLITGLWPIIFSTLGQSLPITGLIAAGEHSGIRTGLLRKLRVEGGRQGEHRNRLLTKRMRTADPLEPLDLGEMQLIWSQARVSEVFNNLAEHLETLLAAEGEHELVGQQRDDDEFGPIRTTTSVQMTGRALNDVLQAESVRTCLATAVGVLATLAYFEGGGEKPARLKTVVKNLLDGTGAQLALVGPHILAVVRRGIVNLSPTELDEIFDRVGGELLPSYEYARSPQVHAFVLDLLRTTAPMWGIESHIEMSFVDKARRLSGWLCAQILSENIPVSSTRMAFIELAASFLHPELSTFAWGHESEPGACHKGVPIPPVSVLIRMLSDQDFCVRFRLATIMGLLCAHVHAKQQQEFSVWESIAAARGFDLSGSGFESNISLLLAYANIMVASDYFRANAYNPIVVYAALDPSKAASKYVSATLRGVAGRLGLPDLATLYTFLAPYTMAEQILAGQETLTIPDPSAFGFQSKRDLYAASFADTAAMVLAGPRPQFFKQMAIHAGLPESNALRACLPIYVGYKLTAPLPADPDFWVSAFAACSQEVDGRISAVAKESGQTKDAFVLALQDVVVYRMFAFIWEPEYHITSLQALLSRWPKARSTLEVILAGFDTVFKPNVLSPPDVALSDILRVLHSDHPVVRGVMTNEALLFVVLSRLTSAIAEPQFVSQQLRLCFNLAICIATCSKAISGSVTLLRLLLSRLARLLEQPDLFHLVASIFKWTLQIIIALPGDEPSCQSVGYSLAEAATIATGYRFLDRSASTAGAERFLKTLESSLSQMSILKTGQWRDAASVALCLWPHRIAMHDKLSFRIFQQVLEHPELRFSNFHILQHLWVLLQTAKWAKHIPDVPRLLWQFASKWKSMDASSGHTRLDGHAVFVDLLVLGDAKLEAPDLADMRETGLVKEQDQEAIQASVLCELAYFLAKSDLETAGAAFEALKAMFAEMGGESISNVAASDDLRMIQASATRSPLAVTQQYAYRLDELLVGDEWILKGHYRQIWQRDFAEKIANALSMRDEVYAPLISALRKIPSLASRLLPHLLHALLLYEVEQTKSKAKNILSEYFTQLLKAGSAAVADVIDCVVALRGYSPVNGKGVVRLRDQWLSVSWSLLAQLAAIHRRPYAAIMFLELAGKDDSATTLTAPRSIQELLYAVYSQIDEPDSFYSIQSLDPQDGLLRQFEHEGRWSEALIWHGAKMEAKAGISGQVVKALAKSDLSRLAMAVLLPSGGTASDKSLHATGMEHELAWKTEAWDLPLTNSAEARNSHATIFEALRTIHRSLDKQAVQDTLTTSLSTKVNDLLADRKSREVDQAQERHCGIVLREVQKTWSGLGDAEADRSSHLPRLRDLPYVFSV